MADPDSSKPPAKPRTKKPPPEYALGMLVKRNFTFDPTPEQVRRGAKSVHGIELGKITGVTPKGQWVVVFNILDENGEVMFVDEVKINKAGKGMKPIDPEDKYLLPKKKDNPRPDRAAGMSPGVTSILCGSKRKIYTEELAQTTLTQMEKKKKTAWVFIGIIVSASCHYGGGRLLWANVANDMFGSPNFDRYMAFRRFKDLKKYFPFMMADETKKDKDKWWMITKFIADYNANRKKNVASGRWKVLDESMSAFRPRTTQTGGLPNITFVKRKPEPLGTEFKVVVCAMTGLLLAQERIHLLGS